MTRFSPPNQAVFKFGTERPGPGPFDRPSLAVDIAIWGPDPGTRSHWLWYGRPAVFLESLGTRDIGSTSRLLTPTARKRQKLATVADRGRLTDHSHTVTLAEYLFSKLQVPEQAPVKRMTR